MRAGGQENPILVQRATTHLITYHPFFASALFKRPLVKKTEAEGVSTAAVTPKGQIFYNEDWVNTLTVKQVAFVLAHECLHYMFMHAVRMGRYDPYRWNWSCDAVINEMLIDAGVGEMPPEGVRLAGAHLLDAETVYANHEPPEKPKEEKKSDDGSGDTDQQTPGGGSQPPKGFTPDDLDPDGDGEIGEADAAEIEAATQCDIRQAVETAKRMGNMPGALDDYVAKLLSVETPWYQICERFMLRSAADDYSFSVFDRRFIHLNQYFPFYDGVGMGEMVLSVDTSGSITNDLLDYFGGHLNKLLSECAPTKLTVLYVHTKVYAVEEYTPDDFPVTLKSKERGGTHMPAAVEWVAKNNPDADTHIILTDGLTDFGEDLGTPTMWAITTDRTPTWGEHVKVEEGK